MNWTVPNNESLLRRLTKPKGKIDVVLDTDTYNELDDQFALSYMMKNSDKLNVKALYAAPFLNDKSVSQKDGMEKSYDEILKLLTLLKREDLKAVTFKGSETYLTGRGHAVLSPAAEDLAKRAMDYTRKTAVCRCDRRHHECGFRLAFEAGNSRPHRPCMARRQRAALAGQPRVQHVSGCCGGAHCFRMRCGAFTVVRAGASLGFTVSEPEFKDYFLGKNELCDYLAHYAIEEGRRWAQAETWSRVIWDVTAVAWLFDGEFMDDTLLHSPIPSMTTHGRPRRHTAFYALCVQYPPRCLLKRQDLVQKLTKK